MNPYITGNDPNHPGVQGRPFKDGMQPVNQDVMPAKIDVLGTGTFPPESQGTVARTQPTGLSAMTQYGLASPAIVPGESPLAGPMTHPLPTEAEDGSIGKAPEPVTRESILEAKQQRLQEQLDQTQAALDSGRDSSNPSGQNQPSVNTNPQKPLTEEVTNGDVEEDEEDDEDR